MLWNSPGMDFSWMTVAIVGGWFGLLLLFGMIARAVSDKRDKTERLKDEKRKAWLRKRARDLEK